MVKKAMDSSALGRGVHETLDHRIDRPAALNGFGQPGDESLFEPTDREDDEIRLVFEIVVQATEVHIGRCRDVSHRGVGVAQSRQLPERVIRQFELGLFTLDRSTGPAGQRRDIHHFSLPRPRRPYPCVERFWPTVCGCARAWMMPPRSRATETTPR